MTFFSQLKSNRDAPAAEPVPTQYNGPDESDSFFSKLKKSRNAPRQEPQYDEFDERPESTKERIQRGGKDVLQQSAKKFTSGLLGSYGNIANLTGLNPSEEYLHPGEAARYKQESDVLEKMQKPGYKPSISDIYSLSAEEDIAPQYSRLPTTRNVEDTIEQLGGPGEATTPEGRYFGRGSEILGGGLSLGVGGVIPSYAAGVAGEAVKDVGGGPLTQAAAEIATMLLTQGRGANPLTSKDPAIQSRIADLRNLGYADKDITLAVNASKTGSNRVTRAKATSASEKAFDETLAKSEGLYNEVLEKSFPGYGQGTDFLHQAASDAYGQVAREGANVRISNPARFQKTIDNVTGKLQNTLGNNVSAQPFLKRLEEASAAAGHNPNADTYINFYKELNELGNWMNPKAREQYISHVKNGIKSTFRNSGPQGKIMAEKFEAVNKGVQKAYQAEKISKLMETATVNGELDWKKLLKKFDKQSTWDTLEQGLGKQEAKNLHKITKLAKEVGDFSKSLGSKKSGAQLDKILTGSVYGGLLASLLLHSGKYGAIGIGAKAALSGGKQAYSRLQTKLLTDPKFQNLTIKALDAIRSDSPKALQRAISQIEAAAQEELDLQSF